MKDISNRSAGLSSAKRSPRRTATGSRILIAARRSPSAIVPTVENASTKIAEEPSMIGTSGPSRRTTASLIPHPANAAIRCSTVPTETPKSFDSRVHSIVSQTRSNRAGIRPFGTSVRSNTIPVLASAGITFILTLCPPCKPTPVSSTDFAKVLCIPTCPIRPCDPSELVRFCANCIRTPPSFMLNLRFTVLKPLAQITDYDALQHT